MPASVTPRIRERCTSSRLSSGVAIVDIDIHFAEPRRDASEFPGAISKQHLRNLGLAVIVALPIQSRPGLIRIVHHETDGTLALLVRELLIRENVDVLFGEGLAKLTKCSRSVFQADCEFFGDRHGGDLFLVHLGMGGELPARSKDVRSYAGVNLTARFAAAPDPYPVLYPSESFGTRSAFGSVSAFCRGAPPRRCEAGTLSLLRETSGRRRS